MQDYNSDEETEREMEINRLNKDRISRDKGEHRSQSYKNFIGGWGGGHKGGGH